MRHRCNRNKLGLKVSHRVSMMRNMAVSLAKNEHGMKTTLARAKYLRRYFEPLITYAKRNKKDKYVVTVRYLLSKMYDDMEAVKKILELADKYKERHGGYTRVLKYGFRKNDNAPLAIIQLV